MNLKKQSEVEFSSRMNNVQLVISLLWIAMHIVILPKIIVKLPITSGMDNATLNIVWYAISTVSLVAVCFTFLRRDFDLLLDNLGKNIIVIIRCYLIILAFDLVLTGIIEIIVSITGNELVVANENNEVVTEMTRENYGVTKATAIFLAPIVEELMFRGAVFGGIRRKNRILAYAVSMIAFSAYHVWSYAIEDPTYWIYILQYLPVSFILCRCYEKCNSIWGSIAFHMSWNAITMELLNYI